MKGVYEIVGWLCRVFMKYLPGCVGSFCNILLILQGVCELFFWLCRVFMKYLAGCVRCLCNIWMVA